MTALGNRPGPIVVTGSSGFIGTHLVAALREIGEEVAELKGRADCDMRDRRAVRKRIRDVSPRAIVHLAAVPDAAYGERSSADDARQTVACAYNLLTAIDDESDILLVQAGSYKQYGSADLPFREEIPVCPRSPYGLAKQISEDLAFSRTGGPSNSVCIRFGPIYGPRQRTTELVPTIVRSLLSAESELMLTTTSWDPLYVADAVEAICLCLVTAAVKGQVINISGGTPVEPSAIFRMVAAELGRTRGFGVVPSGDARGRPCLGDIGKAQRLLGWRPKTPLVTGLRMTVMQILNGAAARR